MEKTIMLGKKKSQQGKRGTKYEMGDFLKEAVDLSLREPSRAAEDRALWTSVIHSIPKSQSQLNIS